jgi:hypothetical protein
MVALPHLPRNEDERPIYGGEDRTWCMAWYEDPHRFVAAQRRSMIWKTNISLNRNARERYWRFHSRQAYPNLDGSKESCAVKGYCARLSIVGWRSDLREQSSRVCLKRDSSCGHRSVVRDRRLRWRLFVDSVMEIVLPRLLSSSLCLRHLVGRRERAANVWRTSPSPSGLPSVSVRR